MATITLTNLSGGLIVCDLKCRDKDKSKVKTLRLNNKQSTTCDEGEISKHLNTLIQKGLVRKTPVKGKPAEKAESDKKEEKQNGNV